MRATPAQLPIFRFSWWQSVAATSREQPCLSLSVHQLANDAISVARHHFEKTGSSHNSEEEHSETFSIPVSPESTQKTALALMNVFVRLRRYEPRGDQFYTLFPHGDGGGRATLEGTLTSVTMGYLRSRYRTRPEMPSVAKAMQLTAHHLNIDEHGPFGLDMPSEPSEIGGFALNCGGTHFRFAGPGKTTGSVSFVASSLLTTSTDSSYARQLVLYAGLAEIERLFHEDRYKESMERRA